MEMIKVSVRIAPLERRAGRKYKPLEQGVPPLFGYEDLD